MHQVDRGIASIITSWIPYQAKGFLPFGEGGGYRYFTGSLGFVLHRLSGLALLAFLFFHIISMTHATQRSPEEYDILMSRFQYADFKIGELALYAGLLFHGINGIRLLLVDFVFKRSHVSKKLFWYFSAAVVVLLLVGAIPLILHSNTAPLVGESLPGGGH